MKNKHFTILSILIAISLLFAGCTQTESNKTETTTTESNTITTIKTTEPVKPSKQ